MLFVVLAKLITGFLIRHMLSLVCVLVGIPSVHVKRVSSVTSSMVHYSPRFTVLTEVTHCGMASGNTMPPLIGFYTVSSHINTH